MKKNSYVRENNSVMMPFYNGTTDVQQLCQSA